MHFKHEYLYFYLSKGCVYSCLLIERELAESPEQRSTFKSSELKGPVPTVSFSEIKYSQEPRRRKTAKINNRERKAMKVLPVVVGKVHFLSNKLLLSYLYTVCTIICIYSIL